MQLFPRNHKFHGLHIWALLLFSWNFQHSLQLVSLLKSLCELFWSKAIELDFNGSLCFTSFWKGIQLCRGVHISTWLISIEFLFFQPFFFSVWIHGIILEATTWNIIIRTYWFPSLIDKERSTSFEFVMILQFGNNLSGNKAVENPPQIPHELESNQTQWNEEEYGSVGRSCWNQWS